MHLKKRWINRRFYEYFAVNVAPLLKWRNPILVYQMGKVGSSSIRNSLFRRRERSTRLVLMSHEFFPIRNRDPAEIDVDPAYRDFVRQEIEQDRRAFEQFSLRKRLGWRFREKFYSERIYEAYVRSGQPLRVITLVREPVANNISMFFELFDHYTGTQADRADLDVDTVIRIFLERYVHGRPLTWLDSELKRTLGIDVFRYAFPRHLGSTVIHEDNRSLLVLKCELDDVAKGRAIGDFLGLDDFEIVRSNVTADRPHARLYAEFKRRIRLPGALLDEMYESKFARFFYSEEERARCRERWEGRRA